MAVMSRRGALQSTPPHPLALEFFLFLHLRCCLTWGWELTQMPHLGLSSTAISPQASEQLGVSALPTLRLLWPRLREHTSTGINTNICKAV